MSDDTKQPAAEGHSGSDTARGQLQMANERTMLAWARTGIAVMALGFVVARFGFLIRALPPSEQHHLLPEGVSTAVGVGLVACGPCSWYWRPGAT